jgi:hypothetical protein
MLVTQVPNEEGVLNFVQMGFRCKTYLFVKYLPYSP